MEWLPKNTTTHQDHVIAHVIGTTVFGYFILEETLYLLLDIGFIWTVYLDGEMGLLPHPVAIGELEVEEQVRREIRADVDLLLRDGFGAHGLTRIMSPTVNCFITEVSFFSHDDRRRLLITGEDESLAIETSLTTGEVKLVEI
ncbi:MAG: hypothetical protein ACREBC_06420 [Pyrinomonadaceae bacterium]